MPQFSIAAILVLLAALATPAAADGRDKDAKRGNDQDERYEKKWRQTQWRQHEARKRYAQRRYYRYAYPWSDAWGPFPGPPGL